MLDGTWFDEFAPIIEAFTHRGIPRRELDEYEIWEIAAALGTYRPDDEPESDDPYAGFDWVAENEAARREGRAPRLPKPRKVQGTSTDISQLRPRGNRRQVG